ncbi:MAG: hypothetical protein ACREA3_06900 [Nitrosotalea sp.]
MENTETENTVYVSGDVVTVSGEVIIISGQEIHTDVPRSKNTSSDKEDEPISFFARVIRDLKRRRKQIEEAISE